MTYFDLYEKVATFITAQWSQTPVLMKGEPIDTQPPYIVLNVYGLGVNESYSCDQHINGNTIDCYGKNSGLTHKLASDVQEAFSGESVNGIKLERVRIDSPITKLNDELYLCTVKFTTRT